MFLIKVVKTLIEHKVKFALAGGYAVALRGAVRGTVDVDVVIATDKDNYRQAEEALSSLNLKSRLPVTHKEVYQFRKEYIEKRNLVAWSFMSYSDPSQVVDIVITHDLNKMSYSSVSLHGVKIPVLSVGSLIAMKKAAGRPQDLEDIKALEALDEKG